MAEGYAHLMVARIRFVDATGRMVGETLRGVKKLSYKLLPFRDGNASVSSNSNHAIETCRSSFTAC